MLLWLISNIMSVGVGLLSVFNAWTLIPLEIGSWHFSWLFYPPMTLCALWMMWFGFWWGAIPAYLATLTFAFYSNIPFDLAWGGGVSRRPKGCRALQQYQLARFGDVRGCRVCNDFQIEPVALALPLPADQRRLGHIVDRAS